MELSIIIVNYNQRGLLKECLKNIEEKKINLRYEILIIDNHSRDESQEFLRKLKNKNEKLKIILNQKNFGYAYACNQGIKNSLGKYILILNPDVFVLPGSVEKLYGFMEKNEEAGICGPKLLNPDGSVQLSCLRFPRWYTPILRRTFLGKFSFAQKILSHYLMKDFDHETIREVDWLLGAALFVKRKAIEKVGLLDERYFLYFEDVDWCRRFHQAGFRVYYFPAAKMFHLHQRFSANEGNFFSRLTLIHILSAFKYFWKWKK